MMCALETVLAQLQQCVAVRIQLLAHMRLMSVSVGFDLTVTHTYILLVFICRG